MIKRRSLLRTAGALLVSDIASARAALVRSRVRPGDPDWPSPDEWQALHRATSGRVMRVPPPFDACQAAPEGPACEELFKELKNPYFIGDNAALTQTSGWIDAWTSTPSVYAVAAETSGDVAAAVSFAREKNLRLVVKGGGHSYLGASCAPDSLLIWTRRMNAITLHEAFVPRGCSGTARPVPAVSVGAGAIWMHTYNAVTSQDGRYVQGGGCGTVGVAGLVLGGGFSSFSKQYGIAAGSLLEAEVVTADGAVRITNACMEPELFWALKGGGGGSFGVVTRLTLRTHDLPAFFGAVRATIRAKSDAAFLQLIRRFVGFYAERLLNPHWGEIVNVRQENLLQIRMVFQGLDQQQAEAVWRPFLDWAGQSPADFTFIEPARIVTVPARHAWDPRWLKEHLPRIVLSDDRPGAPEDNVFWRANLAEAGHFILGFESAWLPAALLRQERQDDLAAALFAVSRHWPVELHFQKGLAGAPAAVVDAAKNTATNPGVLNAFALAIIAGEMPPAFPGLRGHEPDMQAARRHARAIRTAMQELLKVAPGAGAYVAESSFFQSGWQEAYWGANYARLLAAKALYDPGGLFFVHHGVGSEAWSEDGFTAMP